MLNNQGLLGQVQKVISILKINPELRSQKDIEQIINQVEDNKFLSQFKGTLKLSEICKYMSIEFFKERQNIVEEGAMGDKFYIIHSGRVGVYKNVKSEIGIVILRRVVELNTGDSFGELALQQDVPRAATVTAATDSWLITFNKDSYQRIIQNVQQLKIEGIREFFESLPLFNYVSKDNITRIAEKAHFKKYSANTLILRQDDLPTSILFIKSGRFKVLRKVDFRIPESASDATNITQLIRDPTIEEYEKQQVESKLLEIDTLTSGDCFAEQSAILKEPIKYSIITVIPAEVFMVDVADFVKLGREFASSFIQFAKMTPSDQELRRALIEMSRWNFYKEGVTKSIKAEQVNKQKDFDQQLRQPSQIPMKTQDTSERGIDGKFIENKSINQFDGQLVKPNYFSTFQYLISERKKKQEYIQKKKTSKDFLQGFE